MRIAAARRIQKGLHELEWEVSYVTRINHGRPVIMTVTRKNGKGFINQDDDISEHRLICPTCIVPPGHRISLYPYNRGGMLRFE